jgi:hypothetical protein
VAADVPDHPVRVARPYPSGSCSEPHSNNGRSWVGPLFLIIGIGLLGNITAKWLVYSDCKKFVDSTPEATWGVRIGTKRVEFGVRAYTTWLGVVVNLAIPLAFAIAWLFVLILSADIVQAANAGSTVP